MNKFAVINNINPDYAMWDADTRLIFYPFGCSNIFADILLYIQNNEDLSNKNS